MWEKQCEKDSKHLDEAIYEMIDDPISPSLVSTYRAHRENHNSREVFILNEFS